MISAGDFRNGITFKYEGNIFQIVEFQRVKPGKGSAFVRVKMKNLKSGSTTEKTFNPSEKVEKAHIERYEMQYLYSDGDMFHFMNTETYEQIALEEGQLGDTLKFVKENDNVKVLSCEGEILGTEPPQFVELEITETEPNFKGDTSSGATKTATVETGAVIKVPMFIELGEKVKIDTKTGDYLGRV
jgi:elongation factor P